MIYLKTAGVLTLNMGLVGLSDAQANARAMCLAKAKAPGVFEVVKPVQFKVGELVGIEIDDVPKALRSTFEQNAKGELLYFDAKGGPAEPPAPKEPEKKTDDGKTDDDKAAGNKGGKGGK